MTLNPRSLREARPRSFRDLDRDDVIAPYEDPERPVDVRVDDLLARMTLEDKAGLLFHTMITMGEGGSLVEQPGSPIQALATSHMVKHLGITHFNLVGGGSAQAIAHWHNQLQELAASTRLGIPVTISSDPRHHFTDNPLTSGMPAAFSEWPETTGLAAIGDAELVERFADTVRREYLAVGIRAALHPQIDLATEPRWCRINGTFGQDAELTGRLVRAYIRGLQGESLGPHSVTAMTKHFPGAGPQLDGEDAHFAYGREQAYPGDNFDYHLEPFRAAINAGTAQMMPYYGMPTDTPYEQVGFGFNKGILTDLLRTQLGFGGIICTDWGLVTDADIGGEQLPARAWGVEHLSPSQRVLKILQAGADQLGGEACPKLVVELVRSGALAMGRIDESVRRLLREKFVLGLFDARFVDEDAAARFVGSPRMRADGLVAQSRAVTVLANGSGVLPLRRGARVFVCGLDPALVAQYAQVVDNPHDAEVALVRVAAPYEPRPGAFERFFHAGSLAFATRELQPLLTLAATVPTVFDIYLDRPAVIPELARSAGALVADFGARDIAILRALFAEVPPEGRLPFELPRSMDEVRRQRCDVPGDTRNPLFAFGYGLSYPTTNQESK